MSPIQPSPTDAFERRFLLLAVTGISALFFVMVQDLLMALLLGAITAGLAYPLYDRLSILLRGRQVLATAIIIVALILLVIVPFIVLVGSVVGQAVQITQEIGPWVETHVGNPDQFSKMLARVPVPDWIPESALPDREKIIDAAGNAVRSAGSILIDGLAAAGRGTATFLIQLFVFLYAVFYFLLSGRETLNRIMYLSPLGPEDEALIIERFLSVTRATLRGSILIGGLQGFLAGLGFAVAGVPGAAFWGTIVVVLSVIPGAGAPIVWIPAAFWLYATGAALPALLLAAWCALVVGSIDNLLRPRWVGSDAKMSDLMILISTLGGIALFGPVGFIVGPIVAAVFVTLWDMYGRAFAGSLLGAAASSADAPESGDATSSCGDAAAQKSPSQEAAREAADQT
jgi:predicted PurR-regulated permease PerM